MRNSGTDIPPDARKLKAHLGELSAAVTAHLEALDAEMRKPDSHARGQHIAKAANDLELANDRVRYFALGVDYRTDRKTRGGATEAGATPRTTHAGGPGRAPARPTAAELQTT